MEKKIPAWMVMCIITMCAAFLLAATRELTYDTIQLRSLQEKEAARSAVFMQADGFVQMDVQAQAPVLDCYAAQSGGEHAGYVCTVEKRGYGGPIEVVVGLRPDGTVTGISVGGENFAETAGLGAKTKETSFTSQFANKRAPLVLRMDIDAVTGASISSQAVLDAVNEAAAYTAALEAEGKTA